MKNNLKIGLFGGTFNPPHIGHILAAQEFAKQMSLDLLYIMPSCIPPHKEISEFDKPNLRFKMSRIAFSDLPCKTIFSAMELARSGKSFSIDTVNEIIKTHHVEKIFMYVGSDMLFEFEQWKDFKDLFKKCVIVTTAREENLKSDVRKICENYGKKYGCEYKILNLSPIEISSTNLRGLLSKKQTADKAKKHLTDNLFGYIIKSNLYCEKKFENTKMCGHFSNTDITSTEKIQEIQDILPDFLDEDRYYHTIATKRTAESLAKVFFPLFDIPEEYIRDISSAALLHDITKQKDKNWQRSYLSQFLGDVSGNGAVLHSFSGAYYALENFSVNPRVFRSIYNHTTGKADMDIFEKIIFVADYIEPTRIHKQCGDLRKKYFDDLEKSENNREERKKILDNMVLIILENTLCVLEKANKEIHPALFDALKFYRCEVKK